jgi:hypothetical protein
MPLDPFRACAPYRRHNRLVRIRLKVDIRGHARTIVRRAGDVVEARWWNGTPPFAKGWFVQDLGFSCVINPADVEEIADNAA